MYTEYKPCFYIVKPDEKKEMGITEKENIRAGNKKTKEAGRIQVCLGSHRSMIWEGFSRHAA